MSRQINREESQLIRNMHKGGASLKQISEAVDRSELHISEFIINWLNRDARKAKTTQWQPIRKALRNGTPYTLKDQDENLRLGFYHDALGQWVDCHSKAIIKPIQFCLIPE